MERERKVDLKSMSPEEQDALGERIGKKVKEIIDADIDVLAQQTKQKIKFEYVAEETEKKFKKKKVSKKSKDFDLKSVEQNIMEKINKISNIYGIQMTVKLHKE